MNLNGEQKNAQEWEHEVKTWQEIQKETTNRVETKRL